MKSRIEAKKEYSSEMVSRLKQYSSTSHFSENNWKLIEEELAYAFSAGVDFSHERYAKKYYMLQL